MARKRTVVVAFAIALMAMSQMVGCGKDKGTTPEGDAVSSRIKEDIERGRTFLELEEYDKAVDSFVTAIGKEPDSDVAHYYLALTYARWAEEGEDEQEKREEQAVSEYKKLLTLNSPKADDEELVAWMRDFLGLDVYERKRLTDNEADDWAPSFSPDGRQIAFVSDRDGYTVMDRRGEIYVMGSDGSNPRRLTINEAYDGVPSFSSDGRQIVFASNRDGNREIYMIVSDGSDQRRLTVNEAWDSSPSFSPDGRQIVFDSYRDGNREIYVMGSDGSNPRRLTVNEEEDGAPSFSPDGRQIVFVSGVGIYVMGSDGSDLRLLTLINGSGVRAESPSFSPDGTQIVFAHLGEIYMMGSDGSHRRRLAGGFDPSFSPDGRQIVFARRPYRDENREIYVMDLTKPIGRAQIAQALGVD